MLLESVSTESFQGKLTEIQEYYTGVIGSDGAAATNSDGGDDTFPVALHRVEESVQISREHWQRSLEWQSTGCCICTMCPF